MATTTAAITLTSTDLLTDSLSLSATQTLFQAGTTTGLDQARMFRTEVPTGDVYDLLDATARGANTAAKVYIANKHTDSTKYVDIYIAALNIGRLYAGDWMFIPWEQGAATQDIGVEAVGAAQVVEVVCIHQDETLIAS
tara:strand:- start:535 stop:951 length:417 start_codon:yes stop_codon:yes gene_type:complete